MTANVKPIFVVYGTLIAAIIAGFAVTAAFIGQPDTPERKQKFAAAESVGQRCIADGRSLAECVSACGVVDAFFEKPCASAAKRAVLGDLGKATAQAQRDRAERTREARKGE